MCMWKVEREGGRGELREMKKILRNIFIIDDDSIFRYTVQMSIQWKYLRFLIEVEDDIRND